MEIIQYRNSLHHEKPVLGGRISISLLNKHLIRFADTSDNLRLNLHGNLNAGKQERIAIKTFY